MISDIHNEIDQDNGPGKEYKGLIDIGKGDISVTGGVTFPPADQETYQVDEKTDNDNAEGNRTHLPLFCRYKKQIAQKGDDIDKHGGIKKVRIIHCYVSVSYSELLNQILKIVSMIIILSLKSDLCY